MSSKTLTEYFTTIISWSQQFINELPDEFLHDSSKRAYQLINEIQVYLRSWALTKKEYDAITRKTEQLIEEVEKLEIAYEERSSWTDTEEFGKAFKSEFDQVLEKPSLYEIRHTYMSWQEAWTKKVSSFFARVETPIIAWIIASSWVFWVSWITNESIFILMLASGVALGVLCTKLAVRLWWVPFVLLLWIVSIGLGTRSV
jgi:hypothetical protein